MRRTIVGLMTAYVLAAVPESSIAQPRSPNCNYSETRLTIIDDYASDDPGSIMEAGLSEREGMEQFVASLNVSEEIKQGFDPGKFEAQARHARGATYTRARDGRAVGLMRLEKTPANLWRVREAVACGELWQGPRQPPEQSPPEQPPTTQAVVLSVAALTGAAMASRVRRDRPSGAQVVPPVLCAMLIASSIFVIPKQEAAAHCADSNSCGGDYDWYFSEWQADHHTGLSVSYRFTTPFPDGAKKDRVNEAFGRWNSQGQQMQFFRLSDVADFTIECEDNSSPYHGIFWRDIYPLARTFQCDHPRWDNSQGDTLHEFHIVFDSTRNDWHDYLGDPGPGEYDFFSTAVHEVGHATGFYGKYDEGHFDPSGDLCPGSGDHTMCGTQYLSDTSGRTLEEHDKDTFDNAYPNQ